VADNRRRFGPYLLDMEQPDHAVISRSDGETVDSTFYEMQHMKDLAFGGPATAVEVYPAHRDLVDGQHQRHLWRMDRENVPNLHTGERPAHRFFTIGDYTIGPALQIGVTDKISIFHSSGEGGDFSKSGLAKAIGAFYSENF